jgi:hypothetical protein
VRLPRPLCPALSSQIGCRASLHFTSFARLVGNRRLFHSLKLRNIPKQNCQDDEPWRPCEHGAECYSLQSGHGSVPKSYQPTNDSAFRLRPAHDKTKAFMRCEQLLAQRRFWSRSFCDAEPSVAAGSVPRGLVRRLLIAATPPVATDQRRKTHCQNINGLTVITFEEYLNLH